MHPYTVGSLYHPTRTHWPEGADFNWRDGTPELRLFFPRPTAQEVQAVRSGPSEFALLIDGPIIFLCFQFKPALPWSDAPYSWHLLQRVRPGEATIPDLLPSDESRDHLQVLFVDAETGILKALRAVTLSPEFSRGLRKAVRDQSADPFPGDVAYDRHLQGVYRHYPTVEALVKASSVRCVGGEP